MIDYSHPYISPHLFVFDGKKYLMPMRQEVPFDTKIEDIKWNKPEIKKEPQPETWEFASSSGNGTYLVWKSGFKLNCNCPGYFKSKGNCKHIKEVKKINK